MTRLILLALVAALSMGWLGCAGKVPDALSAPHSAEDVARWKQRDADEQRRMEALRAEEQAAADRARKAAGELADIERQMALDKRRAAHETEMARESLERRKLELEGEIAEAEADAARLRLLREAAEGDDMGAAPGPGDGDDWMYVLDGGKWVWKWDPEGRPEWIGGDEEQWDTPAAEQHASAPAPSPAPQRERPADHLKTEAIAVFSLMCGGWILLEVTA